MKEKPKLILVGAGGHARSCIDVIEKQGIYQIVGLVGLQEQRSSSVLGYPVIATDDSLPALADSIDYALITVGQIQNWTQRVRLYEKIVEYGFQLPIIVSPFAYISVHAHIGPGSIIMHGAIVNAGVTIGENCIINSRSLIEHDTTVSSHCHISTGAILNGDVVVGSCSFVGSGSIVMQGITIGEKCLVGMGLTLRNTIEDYVQVKGQENL